MSEQLPEAWLEDMCRRCRDQNPDADTQILLCEGCEYAYQ